MSGINQQSKLNSMAIFNKFYATYYDFLYKGKDYRSEADFFDLIIRKYGLKDSKSILSFGAGTLSHETFLAKKGYAIDGVEISPEMVKIGKEKIRKNRMKAVSIIQGDMRRFSSKKEYDAVLVMFNSVSYCQGLKEMKNFLRSASKAMKSGSVLAFDCWNATVAQKDPPRNTWTKTKIGSRMLYKIVEASPMNPDNSFTRTADLLVVENKRMLGREVEKHTLYSWDPTEVAKIASREGLDLLIVSDFMDLKPINDTRWNMVMVFRKK